MKTNVHFLSYLTQLFLRMRNVSGRYREKFREDVEKCFRKMQRKVSGRCRENQNILVIFNNFFFESLAVYEIVGINIIEADRPQMTL